MISRSSDMAYSSRIRAKNLVFNDRWCGMVVSVDTLIYVPMCINHLRRSKFDMMDNSVMFVS